MRNIVVHSPGMFTTVQDLGREGFGPLGVSASGAADAIALRLGNRLVGNPESAAGLEMTLVGGTFQFPDGTVLALTGSDFGATLDGVPVALWGSVEVRRGQTLQLAATRSGARCYLCVQGGVAVPPFLGSASTHALSGLGGLEGRALRKGDTLPIGEAAGRFRRCEVTRDAIERLSPKKVLRVTDGPQMGWFSEGARSELFSMTYSVAEESNRVGIRLQGPPLARLSGEEMITEGVSVGAVQVPPAGYPILVFVEQQTTGGYPKIANVIAADLHSVGQLRPRDEIRFEHVDMETARKLLLEQEKLLTSPESIRE